MNEHTEQNINEAIDWLQQTGGSIQDFATTQAPLYCQEVVSWEMWSNIIIASFGLAILTFAALLAWSAYKAINKNEYDEPFGRVTSAIIFGVVAVIMVFGGVYHAVKAATAPRLVIVEHLRGLNE